MQRLSPQRPRRILVTTDALGGIWRYSLDLARGLGALGVETVLAGFGPAPDAAQRREAEAVADLRWSDLPLDWMVPEAESLRAVPQAVAETARQSGCDAVQVNLPSQAAGLETDLGMVAVSHSCVVSWFRAVRGSDVPQALSWQRELNARGFRQADVVVAPSRSHAALLAECYDLPGRVAVVPNATAPIAGQAAKQPFAYAAARWWDEGKNAAALDAAAAACDWPVLALGETMGPRGERVAFRHARSLGQRPHAELRDLAATASIFVSPSLYEPFGLAALEAAGAGASLVLADIPTYRELWEGAALFADPRDPAALADATNRLARDPALRGAHAWAARERARGFTRARQAEAMLALHARAAVRAEAV